MNLDDYMPAYPVCGVDGVWHLGMSIRDYFANGPMTEAEFETLRDAYSAKFPGQPMSIAKMRYWRAETMLEAREQWYNEHQTPAPLMAAAIFEEAIKPPEETMK